LFLQTIPLILKTQMLIDIHPFFLFFVCYSGFYLLFLTIWFFRIHQKNYQEKKAPKVNVKFDGISIVVAARNEAQNLLELVPQLFNQDYPSFEVIVIDDCSYDNTTDVLLALKAKYNNFKTIKVVESNKFNGGKKFALTLGIKGATFENLVFIDADCRPSSTQWLKSFGRKFSEGYDFVIGYGGYTKQKSILNFLIRTDTDLIATDYFAAASWKMPYMAVGRNLHLKSGDDDLFLNQVAPKAKVGYLLNADTNTFSFPKETFVEWFSQKQRHVSTFKYYPISKKILLASLWWIKLLIYIAFGLALFTNPDKLIMVIGIFFGLQLIRILVLYQIMKLFENTKLVWGLVIFEPILILFQILFPLIKLVKKEIEWKSNI
jgi:glycosyltransferase involved in cell wall biosynthesis